MIGELHCQQSILLYAKTRSIPDRIVNLAQRQVRPIVRGKATAALEIVAKINVHVRRGFAFLRMISWDPCNEAQDLIPQAKKYKQEYGCYPERICADRIYTNTKNRNFILRIMYDSLVMNWGGRRRIQRSVLLTSSSSAQTSGGDVTPFIGPVLMRVGGRGHAAAPC